MEQLKTIKEQLVAQVQGQMSDLKCVDTHELGEVIDMIKDLAEAIYYCEVADAMEQKTEEPSEAMRSNNYYYTEKYVPMYYGDGNNQSGSSNNNSQGINQSSSRSYYTERDYPLYLRDEREGRSPMKRRMYMETKDSHQDTAKALKDLESYMQDLTADMMEIVEKASPDEKVMLQKKVNTLASKLQNV